MKHFLLILSLLTVICLQAQVNVSNAQTNLITNGDFETGDLTGWTTVSDVKTEKTFQINGSTSARLTGKAASDRQLKQEITLEGGSTYELKFTARITNGGGAEGTVLNDNGGELYALIQIVGEETDTIVTFTNDRNTTASAEFTIPEGVSQATVNFRKNMNIAYIDDISVVKVELSVLVDSVSISASADTVLVGSELQLTAEAFPANATNSELTWHLSSASDSASATITSDGLLTGVAPDTVYVVAKSTDGSEITDSFKVRIVARPINILVDSIVVTAANDSVEIGGTLTLTADTYPLTATNKAIAWSLSSAADSALATLMDGELTGIQAGTVTVVAASTDGSNKSDTYQVVVYEKISNFNDASMSIDVYPNPLKDILHIQAEAGLGSYVLYNIEGKILKSGTVYLPGSIDFSTYQPGVYIMKLSIGTSHRVVRLMKRN